MHRVCPDRSLHDLDGAAGRADCWPDPCPLPASCPDQSFFSNLPYGLAAVLWASFSEPVPPSYILDTGPRRRAQPHPCGVQSGYRQVTAVTFPMRRVTGEWQGPREPRGGCQARLPRGGSQEGKTLDGSIWFLLANTSFTTCHCFVFSMNVCVYMVVCQYVCACSVLCT